MNAKWYFVKNNLVKLYQLAKSGKNKRISEALFYAILSAKAGLSREDIKKIVEKENRLEIISKDCKYFIYEHNGSSYKSYILKICNNLEGKVLENTNDSKIFFEDEEDLSNYDTAETLYSV